MEFRRGLFRSRAERRAASAGCPCKRLSGRDGSHLGVPKEFDQNGPLLRRDVLKYRHMSSPSLLALGHFASNLDDAAIEYGAYRSCPSPLMGETAKLASLLASCSRRGVVAG